MRAFNDYKCEACGRVREFWLDPSGPPPETPCECGALQWRKIMPGPATTFKHAGRYIAPVRNKPGS